MAFSVDFRDTVLGRFVQTVKADRRLVEIITRNGYHIYGHIIEGDDRALLVENTSSTRLVMLASVSTIIPRDECMVLNDVAQA